MKQRTTNKLFYKKWAYRVELYIPGASYITRYRDAIREELVDTQRIKRFKSEEIDNLVQLEKELAPFLDIPNQVKVRSESRSIHLYTNDTNIVDQLISTVGRCVRSVHKPASDNELSTLTDGTNIVMCNKFPHGVYRYKVILNWAMPYEIKRQFLEWSDQYLTDVSFTSGTNQWLSGGKKYHCCPYFYVKSESFLLMAKLFLGSYIKQVDFYVERGDK